MRVKQEGLIQLGSVARAECVYLIKTAVEHKNLGAVLIWGWGEGGEGLGGWETRMTGGFMLYIFFYSSFIQKCLNVYLLIVKPVKHSNGKTFTVLSKDVS